MNKIVITRYSDLILAIEYCDGEPVRVIPSKDEAVTLGSIYVGRVSKVKKELGAAFVDFLPGITGFLPMERNKELKEGQKVIVRVIKEPIKTKGFTLSEQLEIAGEYCVISDKGRDIHCSSKLSDETSDELKTRLKSDYSDRIFGGIIRTNASLETYDALLKEYTDLDRALEDIKEYGPSRAFYSCLYNEKPSYIKLLTDLKSDSFDEIITGDKDIYDEIIKISPQKAVLYSNDFVSLEAKFRIRYAISLATDKKVNLNCGGYLVIEPTEALTVIDVNSGKIDSKKDRSSMIKKVNFEAADMVARQLKLRNISGMIVVDFINFDNEEDENELLAYMRNLLKNDNCKCKVYGFTNLRFMELARQKIRASIYDYDLGGN